MADADVLRAYERFVFEDGPWSRPVYRRGHGPGVIVIHEMPGLHPLVVRFADRIVEAGMSAFMPSLFGEPGRPASVSYALGEMTRAICIRREFDVWARDRSSPIVDWLRALARKVHADCGGRGVGAVGMCFTGNFALAMMTEPSVVAPVLSQPSLPLGRRGRGAVGVSPGEIDCARGRMEREDLTMIGLRFHGDPAVPPERFARLRALFGERFEAIEIAPEDGRPTPPLPAHSVLTLNLKDDDPRGPTKAAEQRVIAFFKAKTALPSGAP